MNKDQRAAGSFPGLLGALSAQMVPLLISEIVRGRAYLGANTTAEEQEQLRKAPAAQLIEDARVLSAAVELRQKTETAEYIRSCMERDQLSSSPRRGPMN